jgi:hypothetical protein|tara:strand:- start:94 stop:276 length:183 start_codon:yes stop_codon:yes gene_type:complete
MTDNNLNVDINFDGIEQVKKKYKKIKKYMKSNLYQIKVIDGTEKVVSNLMKENDNAELLD